MWQWQCIWLSHEKYWWRSMWQLVISDSGFLDLWNLWINTHTHHKNLMFLKIHIQNMHNLCIMQNKTKNRQFSEIFKIFFRRKCCIFLGGMDPLKIFSISIIRQLFSVQESLRAIVVRLSGFSPHTYSLEFCCFCFATLELWLTKSSAKSLLS